MTNVENGLLKVCQKACGLLKRCAQNAGDELPPFANQKNKDLHAQVAVKEGRVRELQGDIAQNTERIKVTTRSWGLTPV